jgi:clan AA aspartic protease
MGHAYVDAIVTALRTQPVRFLVDTGSTWAILPQSIAEAVALPTLPEPVPVSLAEGSPRVLPAGTIIVDLLGRRAAVTTLVMPDGEEVEPLLGIEALEGFGLGVDPVSGRLRPTRPRAGLLVGVRRRP